MHGQSALLFKEARCSEDSFDGSSLAGSGSESGAKDSTALAWTICSTTSPPVQTKVLGLPWPPLADGRLICVPRKPVEAFCSPEVKGEVRSVQLRAWDLRLQTWLTDGVQGLPMNEVKAKDKVRARSGWQVMIRRISKSQTSCRGLGIKGQTVHLAPG